MNERARLTEGEIHERVLALLADWGQSSWSAFFRILLRRKTHNPHPFKFAFEYVLLFMSVKD